MVAVSAAGLQLSNLLKASASLHTVQASGNYLGDRGLAALCGAFCYLNPARVLSLDVSGNGIGDLGAQWLCKGISALCRNQNRSADPGAKVGHRSNSSGIRDLRLRGNNITHSGARDLAKLLSEDRCARELRELDLSMNTITADGFRPLAVSLRGCRELVRLDVGGCRLGPGGVEAAAELIAAAGPKLTTVILTPKAEFADRVLGDRGGLAVALRQSLQRLADSLRFAGTVVEVNLGAFLRGDPAAAASIEETLRENRERAVAVGGERGGGGAGEVEGRRRGGDAGVGGVPSTPSSSRPIEKSRSGGPKRGTPSSGSRTRGETAGVTPTASSGGSRRVTPPHRTGSAAAGSTPGRSTPSGSKEARVRGSGIERPKAGVERPKPGTAERTRRGAAGGSTRMTPPPAPGSAHRTSSKSSLKEEGGRAGVTPGRSSSHATSSATKRGTGATTAATLAARDKAAAAEEAAAAAVAAMASASTAPTPRRRMHQGEELDSIDGFSPTVSARLPPAPPSHGGSSSSSSRRPLPLSTTAGLSRTHSHRNAAPSPGGSLGDGYSGPAGAAPAAAGVGAEGGRHVDTIADVVSKVMGDTEAMAAQESPLCVAPSTWQWQADAAAAAAAGGEGAGGESYPQSSVGEAAGLGPPPPPPSARTSPAGSRPLHPSGQAHPATAAAAGAAAAEGERGGRSQLVRKSSSSSVVSSSDDKGERELSEGMASLALKTDERRPRSDSASRETALEISGGSSSQQLVTMAEAGRLIGPIVAQEVEKEARKIEIRMQNEMNSALRSVRSEMEAIDREGLMARVAMEKRLKSGIKRLLDRIDHLERRFAKVEREDRKRLALEAAPVAAIGNGGGVSSGGGGGGGGLLPYSTSPPQARALPASAGAAAADERRGRGGGEAGGRSKYVVGGEGYAGGGAGAEARPLAVRERWGGEGRRDLSATGLSATGGAGGGGSALSSAAVSDEEFEESGDEAEGDIVRMLEEKMAALEGKLLGHEERQRADPHAEALGDEAFGQGSAVWA